MGKKQPKREPLPKNVKLCKVCGYPFKFKRADRETCGASCRKRRERVAAGELTKAGAAKLARDQRAAASKRRVYGKR